MSFDPSTYEPKWRDRWRENRTYRVENPGVASAADDRPKLYVLDMFPYPSGAGLHVGHPLGYIASDIFARYKRMTGHRVLHPMGYDAFGLPAEEHALKTGIHPAKSTADNIGRYREQFDLIGFSFDWEREVRTSEPSYYRWTQWAFARMFEHYYDLDADKALPISRLVAAFEGAGARAVHAASSAAHDFTAAEWRGFSRKRQADILMDYRIAYRRESFVNWCEALGTVLANDDVTNGVSERGGHPIERRAMLQWSLRTTAYAERLLRGLDELEWTESLKAQQRNWIGRSTGAQVFFEVEGSDHRIEVYTTRPDTIFGTTFMVLAPEHPLVDALTTEAYRAEVADYRQGAAARSDIERQADAKEVSGQFLGAYAVNPLSGKRLPIYVAEYVLIDYGTGAIMAVPSDDERDERFAEHFGIEVVRVVDRAEGSRAGDKEGVLINSGFLDGLEVPAAIERAIDELEARGLGSRQVNYKLRDANFSRQRYWGEPFPIVYDAEGVAEVVPDDDLPVVLPELDDYAPAPGGEGPLARATDWVNLPGGRRRETDTMPAVAGSSWYFLRYMDPDFSEGIASREALAYWRDVDLYVGGTEHAVSHLLYARFWQNFLYDLDAVPTPEPFRKLVNQGMIQGVVESAYLHKDDKRFVSADLIADADLGEYAPVYVHIDHVSDYGSDDSYLSAEGVASFKAWQPSYADTEFGLSADGKFRTHSEVGKMSKSRYNVINPDDIIARYGADCFRMYEMFLGPIEQHKPWNTQGIDGVYRFLRRYHQLYFAEDGALLVDEGEPQRESLKSLHAAIKQVRADVERFAMNTCVSAFMVCVNDLRAQGCRSRSVLEPLNRLLAPFAPYLAEEIWEAMGGEGSVHHAPFPTHEEEFLVESEIEYPVSVNGKKRATASFSKDATREEIEAAALALEPLQQHLAGKTVRKVIVVPGRMVNVVVG